MPYADTTSEAAKLRNRVKAQRYRATAAGAEARRRANRAYRARHPGRSNAFTAVWRAENPHKSRASYLVKSARLRACAKGWDFNLDTALIAEQIGKGVCAVTGLPLRLEPGISPWSPSIDRIDSNKGYTHDNVRVVAWLYNTAKGEFTDEDVLTMSRALAEKIAPVIAQAFKK